MIGMIAGETQRLDFGRFCKTRRYAGLGEFEQQDFTKSSSFHSPVHWRPFILFTSSLAASHSSWIHIHFVQ
jgi:hypothetical protein